MVGLGAHQTNRLVDGWEQAGTGHAWCLLARYGIGWTLATPVIAMIRRDLYRENETADECIEKEITSHLLSGMVFGFGVAIGHLLDELK